ncbi:MAG: putative lipid II flippase FtsW [Nitrospirae bacterium]|nr:putative lipid II flippase FtsW [Nitrospirota bacterium]
METIAPFRTFDRWLLIIVFALMGFGALMVYSSTSVITPEKKNLTPFYYFLRYLLTMAVSLVMMVFAYRVKPRLLMKLSIPLLVLSFVLLILVFVPGIGVTAGRATRWIRLGVMTFQPSELAKLSMVIFIASYMSSSGFKAERFYSIAVPLSVMAVFQVMFLLQPDFGATVTLGILTVSMLFISGIRLRYLLALLAMAVPVVLKLLMEPYRLKRITAFLNPWQDAQGSGFQLVQSFIALGSGGLTGVGLGNGRQKLSFLPEVHTDFIFSIVGEELGFIIAAFVVFLFAFLFIRGVLIADKNSTQPFIYYLSFGLTIMIAVQALMNFFVVTGLAPTKGLPLPFISYGGSSLLVNMTGIGILLNVSKAGHEKAMVNRLDGIEDIMKLKRARRKVYGNVQ